MRMDVGAGDCPAKPEKPQDIRKLVLLVGESAVGSSYLVNRLWQRGCLCEFAASYDEVLALVKSQDLYLVLCPMRLNGRNLLPLIDLLEGSSVSLFYAQVVEQVCWWLPALRHGHKCFGSGAVRPSEFIPLLDELIDRCEAARTSIL